MAIEQVNLGTEPLGTGGDTARTAFEKVNANFSDLDGRVSDNASTVGALELAVGGMATTVEGLDQAVANLDARTSQVDNTSDMDKPVSTAQQQALDEKAPLDSPAFTGIPTAPTAPAETSTDQIATTEFVTEAVSGAQPLNDNLTALAEVDGEADQVPYFSGPGEFSTTPLTEYARGMNAQVDAESARGHLELGSAALADVALEPYEGLVAGPTTISTRAHGTNKVYNCRMKFRAREQISVLKLVYANWYVGGDAHPYSETFVGPFTLAASVEYPRGVIHRCRWGGGYSTEVAGGALSITDPLDVVIPEGAEFWVRSWQDAGAGTIIYNHDTGSADPDHITSEYGPAGSTTDKTAGGTLTNNSSNVSFGPLAIVGQTTKPTVLVMGDSRVHGIDDVADASLDLGTVGRSIGKEFAYINAGRSGERAGELLASHAGRLEISQYCTHIVVQHGTNDIHSENVDAATLKSRLEAIIAAFSGKIAYVVTIEPNSNSTDSFATLANQTVSPYNGVRIAHNATVRAGGIAGAAGYFEIADALESSRDSGLWKVTGEPNGYTDDGNHANQLANWLVRDLGVVDLQKIRTTLPPPPVFASAQDVVRGESNVAIVTPNAMQGAGVISVVERGSGANGSWVKYSDGTAECEITLTSSVGRDISIGQLFRTGTVTWDYPVEFVEHPHVTGWMVDGPSYSWVSFGSITITGLAAAVMGPTSNASVATMSFKARGRWF